MMSIIEPYRTLALLAVILAALAAAGSAGAKIATWKAEAACANSTQELREEIASLKVQISDLDKAIATANQALAVAEAQTKAADIARRIALDFAQEQAKTSRARLEQLEEKFKTAQSCGDVLTDYWELRR